MGHPVNAAVGGKLVIFGSFVGLSLALTPFPVRMVLVLGVFALAAHRLSHESPREQPWFG